MCRLLEIKINQTTIQYVRCRLMHYGPLKFIGLNLTTCGKLSESRGNYCFVVENITFNENLPAFTCKSDHIL